MPKPLLRATFKETLPITDRDVKVEIVGASYGHASRDYALEQAWCQRVYEALATALREFGLTDETP